jgi:hypothetical protein
MVKDTKRDRVWAAVLELGRDPPTYTLAGGSYHGEKVSGFSKADVRLALDDDSSSRTVHDVIQTAVEYGLVEMVKDPPHASVKSHPKTGARVQMNIYRLTRPSDGLSPDHPDEPSEQPHDTPEEAGTGRSDLGREAGETSTDPQYVIECPECEYETTREQNSQTVKSIRRRERVCPECEARLKLTKDDRPAPPICPSCGEEAIEVKDGEDGYTRYIHQYEVQTAAGIYMKSVDSCRVE